MKRLISAIFVFVVILFLCSSSFAEKNRHLLVIGTGGTAGNYYPMGGAMAQIWNNTIPNVDVSVQSTGGAVENIKLLEKGEIELALVQNDLVDYAFNGKEMFERKYTKSRALFSIYPEVIQIAARGELGIKTFTDLKGKKVSFGAPGSGSEANARQILEALGLTYEDFDARFLTNSEAVDQLKDKLLDALMITSGVPQAGLIDVTTLQNITIVSLSKEVIERLISTFPFFSEFTIPAGTYKGQEKDVDTVAVKSVLVAHEDLPDNVVYELVKAIWENYEDLTAANAKAKYMNLRKPLESITIPVHPGAVKYYREIGIY